MRSVVVAAGVLHSPSDLADLAADAELVVVADGGLRHANTANVVPDLIVGDLDSATPDDVAAASAGGVPIVRHPVDKNETDLELAIEICRDRHATEVVVVGALGGRIDHELANIALVAQRRWHDHGMQMRIAAQSRQIWVVHDTLELSLSPPATVSVLPWAGTARGVTTTGVEWPLTDAELRAGSPRGVSNVAIAPRQTFAVAEGLLLVIADSSESARGEIN